MKKIKWNAAKIKGFSMAEMVIALIIIAVIALIAVPKFLSNKDFSRIELSVAQLFSMFELASNEALNRSKTIYVHFLPVNETEGCFVVNDSSDELDSSYCAKSELNQSNFLKYKDMYVEVLLPGTGQLSPLFYFSGATGLPSSDGGVYFYAYDVSESSGVSMRRHQGIVGCTDTHVVIAGWPLCSLF
ncbi:MAG: prepilin-type N-terminal cleavage/methylation domain-containing protein [Vibrionaceae bacterium]